MRKPLIAGNWKMNGSLKSNQALLEHVTAELKNGADQSCDIVIFPPSVYLFPVINILSGMKATWGLQNVFFEHSGAYTGEISSVMAKDLQCSHVLVGHSERRTLFNETDMDIAKKVAALMSASIIPVLCVGETLEERDAGKTLTVIKHQVCSVLNTVSNLTPHSVVIAYEPCWAIGTGRTATPEQAQEVHGFIRGLLSSYNVELAEQTRILYGGSVKGDNAHAIFSQADIDGGLIGGASLKADEFITICKAIG